MPQLSTHRLCPSRTPALLPLHPASLLAAVALALVPSIAIAQATSTATNAPTVARADYPELSSRGLNPVGFRRVEVVDPNRADFLHSDMASGKVTTSDRHIFVTLWYPAASGDPATIAHYDRHPGAGPGSPYADSAQFPQTGQAIADAVPKKGAAPLVILSHGFTNWATYLSELGEILASRGYVVASIDHDDIPYKDAASIGRAFVDTASGRTRDQRAVARQLRAWTSDPTFPLAGTYDPNNLALVGYSMGGFGLLTSAGAGYDGSGPLFTRLPKPAFEGTFEPQVRPVDGLKALVLLAPWGGQPANRAWTPGALASIRVPSLVIDGDHDDVAGFQDGVKWIYDSLTASDRYLLVFENARHNIVGSDAPEDSTSAFPAIEKFDEPVWRKDRIRSIDDHFIVAFLDRYLKGDKSMDSYLNPPTPHSNDGEWPASQGQSAPGLYAGKDPASAKYWPGFQRRWALGLELTHTQPGRPSTTKP